MEVSYGIKIKGLDDPYVKDAESVLEGLADGGTPGRYLVDVFPFMKHIPAWFPGAGWKRKANAWQDVNRYVARKPFELVKEQMASEAKLLGLKPQLLIFNPENRNSGPVYCGVPHSEIA